MKLSFSLSSKPSSKQQQQNPKLPLKLNDRDQESATNKEYVIEFDASKTLADGQKSNKLVIPPKPNEWRPHKKMKNLDLPLQQSDTSNLKFEVEAPSVAAGDAGPNISYGLNLRNSGISDVKNFDSDDRKLQQHVTADTVVLQKLKEDLNNLPDGPGLDEYADMPVEGFGAALLAGYGWYEGRGIGRNAKGDVKVVQYERRTAKEGLGFILDMPTNKNNNENTNSLKKKEKEKKNSRGGGDDEGRFRLGEDVRIIGGRDVGLKGRVLKVVGNGDFVILKLSRSEEEVKVKIGDIAELGSVEEERCLRKLKELKIQGSENDVKGQRVKDHRESKDKRKENKRGRQEGRSERREELTATSQVRWLTSHIRVRIISKDLKGGRLYLKKGEVVDVVGPTTCDISMDDGKELIQGVEQDLLETALPRRGGHVLVLYGKYKGTYGVLVEKDMENETGLVRDADTHTLLNVPLEEIAEYIGDPSYVGY